MPPLTEEGRPDGVLVRRHVTSRRVLQMNTRTMALVALVIAVLLLLFLVVLPRL